MVLFSGICLEFEPLAFGICPVASRRQKLLSRLVLGAFACFCAVWLLRLDHGEKISTNILDLIPVAEQSAEMGLIRGFASNVQARVMLFALRDPTTAGTPPLALAQVFANELSRSPAFAGVGRGGGRRRSGGGKYSRPAGVRTSFRVAAALLARSASAGIC